MLTLVEPLSLRIGRFGYTIIWESGITLTPFTASSGFFVVVDDTCVIVVAESVGTDGGGVVFDTGNIVDDVAAIVIVFDSVEKTEFVVC